MCGSLLIDAMHAALPREAGRPRVQRLVRQLPQIHAVGARDGHLRTVANIVALDITHAHC
jgi:hypothetical protein